MAWSSQSFVKVQAPVLPVALECNALPLATLAVFKLFKCFLSKMCKLIQSRHFQVFVAATSDDSDRWWPLVEAHLDCHANHIYSAFHFMSLKDSVHRKSESGLWRLPRLQYAKRFKLDSFGCSWVLLSRQIRVASWKGCLVFKMLQNSSAFDGSPDAEARLQHRQFFPLGCNTRLTLVRGGEGIQGAWFFLFESFISLMSFRYVDMACILELDYWCLYMVKISTAELHDRHVCMYIFVK